MPVPSRFHVLPPLTVTNGPTSVPAYRVLSDDGSRITEFTGTSGSEPLMSVQCRPPSTVLNTCPRLRGVAAPNPAYAAYATRQLDRSTANCATGRFGSTPRPTRVQVGCVAVTASG